MKNASNRGAPTVSLRGPLGGAASFSKKKIWWYKVRRVLGILYPANYFAKIINFFENSVKGKYIANHSTLQRKSFTGKEKLLT